MFNNRTNNILTTNTFSDEYEVKTTSNSFTMASQQELTSVDQNEVLFNSVIPDNYDKIMHYEKYNNQYAKRETSDVYNHYVSGNADVNPSSTTMQFYGISKEDINKDLKVEENTYTEVTKTTAKTKFYMLVGAVAIIVLSILIVFNTALLKNMNTIINTKVEQVAVLEQQYRESSKTLQEVSSDQNIIDTVKGDGWLKKE